MKYIAFSQTISFSPFFPRENEGSPLLAQNKVRADIFSGSLAVFTIRKGRFSAKEDGRRRAEGGFRGEFRPLYAFFSKSVRIFSYAHRHFPIQRFEPLVRTLTRVDSFCHSRQNSLLLSAITHYQSHLCFDTDFT